MRNNEEIKTRHLESISNTLGVDADNKVINIKMLIHGTLRLSAEFDNISVEQKIAIINKIFGININQNAITPEAEDLYQRVRNSNIFQLIGNVNREEVSHFNRLNRQDRIYLLAESIRDLFTQNDDGSVVDAQELQLINTAIDNAIANIPNIPNVEIDLLSKVLDLISLNMMYDGDAVELDRQDEELTRLLNQLNRENLSRSFNRFRNSPLQSSVGLAVGIYLISMAYRGGYVADFSGSEGLVNSALAASANTLLAAGLIDVGSAAVSEVSRFINGENSLRTRVLQIVGAGLASYFQYQNNSNAGVDGVEGASLVAGAAAFGVGATNVVSGVVSGAYNVADRLGAVRVVSDNMTRLQALVGDFMRSNFYQTPIPVVDPDVENALPSPRINMLSRDMLRQRERGMND